ncbi:MAG: hypothetical protein ACREFH_16765, partial [Stellaceae bacterium]
MINVSAASRARAVVLTGLILSAGGARAGCVSSGTDAFTCSGDFSSGLVVQDEVPSSTTTVTVSSLT